MSKGVLTHGNFDLSKKSLLENRNHTILYFKDIFNTALKSVDKQRNWIKNKRNDYFPSLNFTFDSTNSGNLCMYKKKQQIKEKGNQFNRILNLKNQKFKLLGDKKDRLSFLIKPNKMIALENNIMNEISIPKIKHNFVHTENKNSKAIIRIPQIKTFMFTQTQE